MQTAPSRRVRQLGPFARLLAVLALALLVTGCGGTISVGNVPVRHTYSAQDRDDFVSSCARGGGDSESCNCVFNHIAANISRDQFLVVAQRIQAGTMTRAEQAAFYQPYARGCEPKTYTPAIRRNFIDGCAANGGKRAYCGCFYDKVRANVPISQFLADDAAMTAGTMSQEQFQQSYGRYMKPCL